MFALFPVTLPLLLVHLSLYYLFSFSLFFSHLSIFLVSSSSLFLTYSPLSPLPLLLSFFLLFGMTCTNSVPPDYDWCSVTHSFHTCLILTNFRLIDNEWLKVTHIHPLADPAVTLRGWGGGIKNDYGWQINGAYTAREKIFIMCPVKGVLQHVVIKQKKNIVTGK